MSVPVTAPMSAPVTAPMTAPVAPASIPSAMSIATSSLTAGDMIPVKSSAELKAAIKNTVIEKEEEKINAIAEEIAKLPLDCIYRATNIAFNDDTYKYLLKISADNPIGIYVIRGIFTNTVFIARVPVDALKRLGNVILHIASSHMLNGMCYGVNIPHWTDAVFGIIRMNIPYFTKYAEELGYTLTVHEHTNTVNVAAGPDN